MTMVWQLLDVQLPFCVQDETNIMYCGFSFVHCLTRTFTLEGGFEFHANKLDCGILQTFSSDQL